MISPSYRTKYLAALLIATVLITLFAGSAFERASMPKGRTTSINVHNLSPAVPDAFPGRRLGELMGLEDPSILEHPGMFQLNIEHTYVTGSKGIKVLGNETKYLVLNFTIYVDEIWGEFAVLALPSIDIFSFEHEFTFRHEFNFSHVFEVCKTEVECPMYEGYGNGSGEGSGEGTGQGIGMSFYIEPFGFKVEIPELKESCWLDSKYIICDPEGYSYQENFPPVYEHDPVSLIVVVSFTAAAELGRKGWTIVDPKVYLNNLAFFVNTTTPFYLHGPMVSVHVKSKVMSYGEFWKWITELHPLG